MAGKDHFEAKEKVKVKLTYDADTFGDIYGAAKTQMATFNSFCKKLSTAIGKDKLKYEASANLKKAPRSFYKAYFWYTGDKSHNKYAYKITGARIKHCVCTGFRICCAPRSCSTRSKSCMARTK